MTCSLNTNTNNDKIKYLTCICAVDVLRQTSALKNQNRGNKEEADTLNILPVYSMELSIGAK